MVERTSVEILDEIPFEPDLHWLMKRLRVKEGSENAEGLARMLEQARPLARPRAMFMIAYINDRDEDGVVIEGHRFTSRVLRVNLDQAYRVFPYLATCGMELQAWADSFDDMLEGFWAEAVKEAALFCALNTLSGYIDRVFHPGKTATMSPGSLQDWPIQQQRMLFDLFDSAEERIGVHLTDSMLMIPTKTVSGIRFPTEVDFESCELCPREGCPGRRAVYNPDLYDSRYCRQTP